MQCRYAPYHWEGLSKYVCTNFSHCSSFELDATYVDLRDNGQRAQEDYIVLAQWEKIGVYRTNLKSQNPNYAPSLGWGNGLKMTQGDSTTSRHKNDFCPFVSLNGTATFTHFLIWYKLHMDVFIRNSIFQFYMAKSSKKHKTQCYVAQDRHWPQQTHPVYSVPPSLKTCSISDMIHCGRKCIFSPVASMMSSFLTHACKHLSMPWLYNSWLLFPNWKTYIYILHKSSWPWQQHIGGLRMGASCEWIIGKNWISSFWPKRISNSLMVRNGRRYTGHWRCHFLQSRWLELYCSLPLSCRSHLFPGILLTCKPCLLLLVTWSYWRGSNKERNILQGKTSRGNLLLAFSALLWPARKSTQYPS